jgi:hypothetical protein
VIIYNIATLGVSTLEPLSITRLSFVSSSLSQRR